MHDPKKRRAPAVRSYKRRNALAWWAMCSPMKLAMKKKRRAPAVRSYKRCNALAWWAMCSPMKLAMK